MNPINIGIEEADRKQISEGLLTFLAETYSLYAKTHNFHWNVTGHMFDTLHKMFEAHYNELWLAIDEIAERVRALGYMVPGNFAKKTSITMDDVIPGAQEMVKQLVEGHETVIRAARDILAKAANVHDEVTVDLLTNRMSIHEKTAWMLRSLLQ